jgi:hypothetical protein
VSRFKSFAGNDLDVSDRGALVGVFSGMAGLMGRTTTLVGFRGSCPNTCAALDGIGGVGTLWVVLPNEGMFMPKIFFFGLLIGSMRSAFFSSLTARHCSRKSCVTINTSSLLIESVIVSALNTT